MFIYSNFRKLFWNRLMKRFCFFAWTGLICHCTKRHTNKGEWFGSLWKVYILYSDPGDLILHLHVSLYKTNGNCLDEHHMIPIYSNKVVTSISSTSKCLSQNHSLLYVTRFVPVSMHFQRHVLIPFSFKKVAMSATALWAWVQFAEGISQHPPSTTATCLSHFWC